MHEALQNNSTTTVKSSSTVDFSNRPIPDQVKAVLMNPKTCWSEIAADPVAPIDLYSRFIAKFGAIRPICEVIGLSIIGTTIPELARLNFEGFSGTFRTPFFSQLVTSAIVFAISLGVMYLWAKLMVWLAPKFQGQVSLPNALKIGAYCGIPSVLSSIFLLVPATSLRFLGSLVALYSVYLFIQAVPHLTSIPDSRRIGYIVTLVIISIGAFVVLGGILAGLGLAASI